MASLGNDLAQIRKKRNLSLDDIQEATKIPKHVLRSIEDDSIFTDFKENSTYIRSYVRGYAKALSIDDKQIIHALNKREIDDYSGSLQKVAGVEPSSSELEEDDKDKEQNIQHKEPSDQEDEPIHDSSTDSKPENEEAFPPPAQQKPSSTGPDASERSKINSIDWAEKGQQFQQLNTGKSKLGLGILIVIIAISGGLFFFYFAGDNGSANSTDGGDTNEEAEASLTTDSLELNISPSTESNEVAKETLATETDTTSELQNESFDALPDTLIMVVYAAYGRLEPVRVYTDIADSINPYWIEEGEAMRFRFVNEIRIRGEYDNIALIMNGHVVQNLQEEFYNPETRLLEINRSYFEDDPQWLQSAPDSLGIDAPSPSVIHERPTYN